MIPYQEDERVEALERALRLLMSLEGVVFAADPKERPMLAQSVVREVCRRALANIELDPESAREAAR